MTTKQVIVMRKDLNMRKGKMCAQAAHASMAFITRGLRDRSGVGDGYTFHPTAAEQEWLDDSFTKICVSVDSEEELFDIATAAGVAGLLVHVITDNGATEFNGVPTNTCIAIGPDLAERIDPITSHLRLL